MILIGSSFLLLYIYFRYSTARIKLGIPLGPRSNENFRIRNECSVKSVFMLRLSLLCRIDELGRDIVFARVARRKL